jgi:hypothetical protein
MLLSKRQIENSKITTTDINVNGYERKEFTLTNNGRELMKLLLGLKNISPVLLLGPVREDEYGRERFLPYTIETKATLDANSDEYIKSIMGNSIFYSSGYNIHLFGLYYENEVEGYGMIEGQRVMVQEDGTVVLEPAPLNAKIK